MSYTSGRQLRCLLQVAGSSLLLAAGIALGGPAESAPDASTTAIHIPDIRLPDIQCTAEQTGGFHDYPGEGEVYEPALFHPQSFTLEENLVFMMNLAVDDVNVDLYLTMTRQRPVDDTDKPDETDEAGRTDVTELECRQVRGANDNFGFSCVNVPPSEMLMINAESLRFTRTAVGGWTFAGANDTHNGDSIFVEFGQCRPLSEVLQEGDGSD